MLNIWNFIDIIQSYSCFHTISKQSCLGIISYLYICIYYLKGDENLFTAFVIA